MTDDARELLARLAAREETAWPEFLQQFAPLLLQVSREIEREPDAAADAFLFICERLAADAGQRLRRFDPSVEGASFTTWLRVVAWNLALDARRHRRGRFRPLAAIRRLPILQQRIYRLRYEEGLTSDETFAILEPEFPGLLPGSARGAEADVDRAVGSRERFVLSARRPAVESLSAAVGDRPRPDPSDSALDPEAAAIHADLYAQLRHALDLLAPADRLLIQLRFEEGVTLSRLASMLGMKDPWTVVRRLNHVLKQLRETLDAKGPDGSV